MFIRQVISVFKSKIFQPQSNLKFLISHLKPTKLNIYRISTFNFAAGKKPGDKKGKIKAEKENIEKEYDGLSEEDLKQKYIEKAEVVTS